MAKKLNQYRGLLTPDQVATGINCANRNAQRLADDAQLLLDHKRFPTACAIAALAIEEAGKAGILRHLACTTNQEEARKLWRSYRSHTAKNAHWRLPEMFLAGASRLRDFAGLYDEKSDHPEILDQIKQIGFYTDCLGEAYWSEPIHIVDEYLAAALVRIAKLFALGKQVLFTEIELWVKIVGPHLNGTMADAEAALIEWYEQMQFAGLAPHGNNAMRIFIEQGIARPSK